MFQNERQVDLTISGILDKCYENVFFFFFPFLTLKCQCCTLIMPYYYSRANKAHCYWKWRVIIAVNLLPWSLFTFIYNRSTIWISYNISHHFTARKDMNSTHWPRSQLHSSVGRASHWYRGGHGFKSCWSPDIFQASSFQLLKLENILRWSLFTFIYNRSTIWISYIYFTSLLLLWPYPHRIFFRYFPHLHFPHVPYLFWSVMN